MSKSILKDKSYLFAVDIVKLSQSLQKDKKEFILSKQLIKQTTNKKRYCNWSFDSRS